MLAMVELEGYVPGWPGVILEGRINQLAGWISEPTDPMGYGISRLMNDICQRDKALGEAIIAQVDPNRVAAAVSSASASTVYSLAKMIDRIAIARSPEWKKDFNDSLDREACINLAATWPADQSLSIIAEFCAAFMVDGEEFPLDLVEALVPRTEKPLIDDPIGAFRDLDDIAWHVLRVIDPLSIYVGPMGPSNRTRSLARRISAPLRPTALAQHISAAQKRDFQTVSLLLTFLRDVAPAKYKATVVALDWQKIETTIGDDWENLFHEAQVLLGVLYTTELSKPFVDAMIERNLHRIVILPPRLVLMSPKCGYRHVEAGGRIGLTSFNHVHWREAVGVLAYFVRERPNLLDQLLGPHEAAVGAVLSNTHPSWYKEATLFIHLMREVAPASLARMLSFVNVAAAEEGWSAALRAKGDGRRTVALLIEAAVGRADELGAMANRLRKRFSRLSQPSQKDLEAIDFS
jgi:hypothetical protein